MHVIDAQLRHRELTQEVYNIGDEVAEYIEHVAEAIADWDSELVWDCIAECEEILAEAADDSRDVLRELVGIRRALTSGVRSGRISAYADRPQRTTAPQAVSAESLVAAFPLDSGQPVIVRELSRALAGRTQTVLDHLSQLVEWVLAETAAAAVTVDRVPLAVSFHRTLRLVEAAAEAWSTTVADAHPAYTRTMRGTKPPEFLAERARIDAVVARVAAKLGKRRVADSGFAS